MYRVVVEHFQTPEEAVEFRNKMNNEYQQSRAHIEALMPETRHDWRIWTFK